MRAAVIVAAVGTAMAISGNAVGAPPEPTPGADIQGEAQGHADKDARNGKAQPTATQRRLATGSGATVRWNDLGTPESVRGTQPLATGLGQNPIEAAKAYLERERGLFGLSTSDIADLEVLTTAPIGQGAAVVMRQRLGSFPAAVDGLVTVGVVAGSVVSVSSSLTRNTAAPAAPTISDRDAVTVAERNAGIDGEQVEQRRVRLVAVPTAQDGNRAAYEVVLLGTAGGESVGRTAYIDARTGSLLVQEDLVDHDTDNPTWQVYPANPASGSAPGPRSTWCWTERAGCDLTLKSASSPLPWDVDPATGTSTTTTFGNNALGVEKWNSSVGRQVGTSPATPRPDRNYSYPFTNQWSDSKCSPTTFASPARNDIDAATANLFAQHNRMHDWSYQLGFSERTWNLQKDNFGRGGLGEDHERGNAQAGGIVGGPPLFLARDNANQSTPPDGLIPVTNMYLWQPIAGGFYSPCVDGDFDMTVIGHEYTHAITNRMVAGPDVGISGSQGGAMGESWSDQFAMEQLSENGFNPAGDTPYVIGAYVTGDTQSGIRNYDMSLSPLNYSDIGYDLTGVQVHADGEIWSATGFALRQAFINRYGSGTAALERSCAEGNTSVETCSGNRRWIQLQFDSLLLQATGRPSMVDMRDNLLAADAIRFGGANRDLIWDVFASRGLGEGASSNTNADPDPVAGFASPTSNNATVTFKGAGDASSRPVRLFIGDYEARAVPVADTDPATATSATFRLAPGTYRALAVGSGLGHQRFSFTVKPGQVRDLPVNMARNLASAANGATASGDGGNLPALIDDTEATNWASLGAPPQGRTVTVRLAGDTAQPVRRIQVSALLRPADSTNTYDPGSQNRFTALRSFTVLACDAATGQDCAVDSSYRQVLVSTPDAFPAGQPRPTAPDLTVRSYDVGNVRATHLRLVVGNSQCTGAPAYAGEQDNDNRAVDDCTTGAPASVSRAVRAAEFQAFSR